MFGRLRFPGRQSPPQGGAAQSATSHQPVHSHGAVDAAIFASQRGIWATKVSLLALVATAATGVERRRRSPQGVRPTNHDGE